MTVIALLSKKQQEEALGNKILPIFFALVASKTFCSFWTSIDIAD